MKVKKAIEKKVRKPEEMIIGTDPVAISLLKQIYSGLKDRQSDSLDFFEKCIVEAVEKTYTNKLEFEANLLENLVLQVQQVLNGKDWHKKKEEFYATLEKIIFLKAREDVFKNFFESVESAIMASMQLDFSKRVPITTIAADDKRNILNYASLMLNTLVETMSQSVVSMKTINAILAHEPETFVIITDEKGIIRFVSELGEEMLQIEHNSLLGQPVKKLIKNFSTISRELKKQVTIKDTPVTLVLNSSNGRTINALVTVPKVKSNYTEVEEVVYLFKKSTPI